MKQLINDNPFYGKAGTLIGDNTWRNLPNKHKKLFKIPEKEQTSNKKDPFAQFTKDMGAFNPFGDVEIREVRREGRIEPDIPQVDWFQGEGQFQGELEDGEEEDDDDDNNIIHPF